VGGGRQIKEKQKKKKENKGKGQKKKEAKKKQRLKLRRYREMMIVVLKKANDEEGESIEKERKHEKLELHGGEGSHCTLKIFKRFINSFFALNHRD